MRRDRAPDPERSRARRPLRRDGDCHPLDPAVCRAAGACPGSGQDSRLLRSRHPPSRSCRPSVSRHPELRSREFLGQTLCRISIARPGPVAGAGWSAEAPSGSSWVASRDEVFGVLSERAPDELERQRSTDAPAPPDTNRDQAVVAGTLRAPWKWESLLVESAVIGGSRSLGATARRIGGAVRPEDSRTDGRRPDSPRIPHFERELQNLEHLRVFALPLIETMSAWPDQATWGDWLQRLEGFAPQVLRQPRARAPRAGRSPTHGRCRTGLVDRSARRARRSPWQRWKWSRPRIATAGCSSAARDQARGRAFRVVFVPGLAERLFPQKLREDPLLLDDLRQ